MKINKLFKVFVFLIILTFSISFSYSALTTNNTLYYSFDEDDVSGTTMFDLSPNSNDGACFFDSGCNTVPFGIIENASQFDGTDDYINTSLLLSDFSGEGLSISFWANTTQTDNNRIFSAQQTSGNFRGLIIHYEDDIRFFIRDNSDNNFNLFSNVAVNDGQLHHVVTTYNPSTGDARIYVDGQLNASTNQVLGSYPNEMFILGMRKDQSSNFQGIMDEASVWKRELSSAEVTQLYNNGNGNNFYEDVVINSNITDFYNTLNISVQVNTSKKTNLSFSLNGFDRDICTNCNSSSFNLFETVSGPNGSSTVYFAQEGENNISIKSNRTGSIVYLNQTFTVDTIKPNLTVQNNTEINSYNINFSNIINFSDANLDTCKVFTDEGNITSCTSSYEWSTNGNHTFNVSVNDSAGNVNTSNNNRIFVNPFQTFRFNDVERSILVSDYSFASFSTNSTELQIKTYDLGLGTHTLEFRKQFYLPQNFTFTFTDTSRINQTFNVTPVDISAKVFDEDTLQQIKFNLTFDNGTQTAQFNNQFNFSEFSNNIPSGNLTMIFDSNGYSKRKIFTENTPFSAINFEVYLLSQNFSTPVIFEVLQSRTRNPLDNVEIQFRKLVNGTRIFLGEAKTDAQGLTFFNLDTLDEYEVTVTKSGFVRQSFTTIPGKTEYTLLLSKEGVADDFFFNQFSYKILPTGNVKSLPFTASAQTVDQQNKISLMRFEVTGDNTSFSDTSTQPGGDTISFNIVNKSQTYTLNLTVTRQGITQSFVKTVNFFNESTGNFTLNTTSSNFLQNEEDPANRVMFSIFMYILFMVAGAVLGGLAGGSQAAAGTGAMAGIIPIMYYISVDFISLGIGSLIILATVAGVLFFKS